jgi:hypothetical protein
MAANDTLVLTASADGDAQFTVDVNGQQVGGTYDVTAAHGAGQAPANTQDVTLTGDFSGSQPPQIAVNFLNQDTADLYIESVNFDGTVIQGNQAVMNPTSVNPGADPNAAVMYEDGTATFTVGGSTTGSGGTGAGGTGGTGGTGTGGSGGTGGSDTLILTASADGDAQFTVSVNGQQIGGVYDVTAAHGDGTTAANTQNITLTGDFTGSQPAQVTVNFLDQATADLYIESASLDGTVIQGNQAVLNPGSVNAAADPNAAVMFEDGTATFTFNGSTGGSGTGTGGGGTGTGGEGSGTSTPVVTATDTTVQGGQSVALSQIFSASDPTGNTISQYQAWLGDGNPADPIMGSLTMDGHTYTVGNQPLAASNLDQITYNGSANAGTDQLWLRATDDGTNWSQWTLATITDSGDASGSSGSSGSGSGSGSGNQPITMTMSADGDAQFTVDVNGQQVGGIYDVTAAHGTGTTAANTQTVTLPGDFSTAGPLQVAVNFTNDPTADLYIESITADGQTIQGNQATMTPASVNPAADPNAAVMFENGTATFNITPLVQSMAGTTNSGSGGTSGGNGQVTDQNQTTLATSHG